MRWREDPIRMDIESKWSISVGMRLPQSQASRSLSKLLFLPLKLEHNYLSIKIEHYQKCITHCMKECGGETACCSRKKGVTQGVNTH